IKGTTLSLARREMQIELERWKREIEQQVRLDAIQKSQAVTLGKITEHFIPYLPEFTYNPKDARFIGSPIDFIVFDGLTDGEVKKVVFMEIKTGSASLSSRERRIRDAVLRGNVSWEELRSNFNLEELS
ncbi:MAG: Holliday junction resolvase-like protein, partial [Anaerolineales bacterium]